jgi:hypothetical protein
VESGDQGRELPERRTTDREHGPDQRPGDEGAAVVRATFYAAGSALGTVVVLTVLSGWANVGTTATVAISTVGAIMTAAFAVAGVFLRRNR